MNTITSAPLELPGLEDVDELSRADLVFYGVDHSGPSYEGRVFVNNATADASTERVLDHGYAGSFTVFGHNGCFGDAGHCLPDQRYRDEFDLRAPDRVGGDQRQRQRAQRMRRALVDPNVRELTVTVVAVIPEDNFPKSSERPLRFDYIRLLAYEG